jgi:chorismate mutase
MNSNQPKLTKDVHMRVSESLQQLIQEIADQNHMKPSSLCRVVLARELPNYTRNRFYG